mmetsp:Transcript_118193/g.294868  ORF Transcript_118193/g.294868 Transcript_118193/m.294868 type:complete len:124 (+) Transcript_118193:759-1130(+)
MMTRCHTLAAGGSRMETSSTTLPLALAWHCATATFSATLARIWTWSGSSSGMPAGIPPAFRRCCEKETWPTKCDNLPVAPTILLAFEACTHCPEIEEQRCASDLLATTPVGGGLCSHGQYISR